MRITLPSRIGIMAMLWLLVLSISMPAQQKESEAPTVVIIIRHAEKESQGADPGLSAAGVARTEALIDALAGADVSALYATEYARTRQTLQPLANRLGRMVIGYPIGELTPDQYAAALAVEILATFKGKTVVVAGHSNTVPHIVRALGVRPVAAIGENEFDRMYIVVIPSSGQPRVIATRYGE
jgi:phosphohistidine phosphatase SixA